MRFITKFLFNKKVKRYYIITLLLTLYIFVSALSYTRAVCSDIQDSVFRLHIIANSDSDDDQKLKYIVRDSVINYINKISTQATSKEEVMKIAQENLPQIQSIASQTIIENGYDYTVNINIGNFFFPTKQYGDITFPPGYYDALKIEIGEANGQNWWCVMFPPLCFVDVTSGIVPNESKENLKNNLSQEEYDLISTNSTDIELKFKIVEVLQNFTISGIFN